MNFDLFLHTNPKLSASFTSFYLRNPKQFKVTWINNGIKAEGLSVYILFSSVSRVWLFVTLWTAACQASLFITNSWSLFKLMSVELVMPSNHLILCHPLFFMPSIFLSVRVFSNESVLHISWPKIWSFSISPANEYSGLIAFRIDWLDQSQPVPRDLKNLLQHQVQKHQFFGT